MRITAAGCFETAMRAGKAGIELAAARGDEAFVGAPAARRKTLRVSDHLKRITGRAEMFLTAVGEIRLHSRTQSIAEAVGVMVGKHVLVFRERIEIGLVKQKPFSQFAVSNTRAALPGKIKVLRQSVRFIPRVVICRALAD